MKESTVNTSHASERLTVRSAWGARALGHEVEILDLCLGLDARISGERRPLGEQSVFLKGGPLSKSGARRHRLRGIFLGTPLPALSEFRAAHWLRERLFQAPEPVAALEVRVGAGPRRLQRPSAQLFVSSEVPGAEPFTAAWERASRERRLRLCHELGGELGRMHSLHFLHADLYPRNVLVQGPGSVDSVPAAPSRQLWFIDSWAGGCTAWRNGSLRRLETDLGTWLADFEPGLSEPYVRELLGTYADARSDNGRPVPGWTKWISSVVEARRTELRKLERQRYRLRGKAFPTAGVALPNALAAGARAR